jgi:hypothetical protein
MAPHTRFLTVPLAREALAAQRDHLIDDGRARRLSQALRA